MRHGLLAAASALSVLTAASLAMAQGVTFTIEPEKEKRVKTIIKDSDRVTIKERVTVGAELPETIVLRAFPSDVDIADYSYVVDESDRIIVVHPKTRKVVRIIER